MSAHDISDLLAKAPRNCWLALNEQESAIVGRGETMQEAINEAKNNGVEDPMVIWAPKSWSNAVYFGAFA
ncbi:MAG: hypothetical protein WCD43_02980 [Candidatus Acidiferrales bacterium]